MRVPILVRIKWICESCVFYQAESYSASPHLEGSKTTTKGWGTVIHVSQKNNERRRRSYTIIILTYADKLFLRPTDSCSDERQSWGTWFGSYKPWSRRQHGECVKCGLLMACLTGQSSLPPALCLYKRLYVWARKGKRREWGTRCFYVSQKQTDPSCQGQTKSQREEAVFRQRTSSITSSIAPGSAFKQNVMENSWNWGEIAAVQGYDTNNAV